MIDSASTRRRGPHVVYLGNRYLGSAVESYKCLRIDESERDAIQLSDFNPPVYTTDYTRDNFLNENYAALDIVVERLSEHWSKGIGNADSDFFADYDYKTDRVLLFEITSRRMMCDRLVPLLQEIVQTKTPSYMICVCNDMWFMKCEDGSPYPDFNLFVSKGLVRIFSTHEWVIQTLGMEPSS